jgi:hypothetical protein
LVELIAVEPECDAGDDGEREYVRKERAEAERLLRWLDDSVRADSAVRFARQFAIASRAPSIA